MVANSTPSRKSVKQRTTKTVALTPEQAIEILQQTLIECRKAGIDCKVSSLYHQGQQTTVIMVANVEVIGGNLRLIGGNDVPPEQGE